MEVFEKEPSGRRDTVVFFFCQVLRRLLNVMMMLHRLFKWHRVVSVKHGGIRFIKG